MWKKRIAVLALLIMTVGTVSAAAFAQDDTGQGEGKTEIEGRGALWARGSGSADLDVRAAKVQIRLNGDITIVGPAGLDVRINGAQSATAEGGETVIVLTDFTGAVAVRGVDFTIHADGDMALRGRGSGEVTLTGEGHWRTRHDQGRWTGIAMALPEWDSTNCGVYPPVGSSPFLPGRVFTAASPCSYRAAATS